MLSRKKQVLYDSDSDEESSEIESIDNDTIESSEDENDESDVEIDETFNEEEKPSSKKTDAKRSTGSDDYTTADSEDESNKSDSVEKEISPIKSHESSSFEEEISPIKNQESDDQDEESRNDPSNLSDKDNEGSNLSHEDIQSSMENHVSDRDDENKSESSDSDSEEIVPNVRKNTRVNRIEDSDSEESEQEEERRKTLYRENPEGDLSFVVEDNIYSKATRRSIFGFPENNEVKLEPISAVSEQSDDEADSDIILCDSESEEEQENFANSEIAKKMSSTIRSPFKEIDRNVTVKEESLTSPEKSVNLQKVSKSYYDSQVAEIEAMQGRMVALRNLELKGSLPDGGQKLRIAAAKIQKDIDEKENLIKTLIVDEDKSIKNQLFDSFKSERSSIKEITSQDEDFLAAEDVQPKYTGKVGMKHFEQQKALTVEKLQDIHNSLDQRPADDVVETPPKYLKIELMKHQLHALAFMIWREAQKPRGGILADDMGLGKTLTVIALILKQLQIAEDLDEESDYDSDENDKEKEDQWIARGHKSLRNGGTLVVCPASLINQWEHEIKNKVKRNALKVNVFHGAKRETRAKLLASNDVVITTYQIILSESKNEGCLFGIKWDRIVLDEGHVIRNYRSKQSEAVCALIGKKRWVLTGTPIQNKEFDIYAAIKFLRCSPFDDIRYWRMWIETKKGASSPRLQTLLKSILLRRTKKQLMETGEVQSLPEKQFEEFQVILNREERGIYNRILSFSQAIFAQFLSQHQEKYNNYTYDRNQLGKLHQKFAKIHNVEREVKAHEILTLLLRLRQVCCHAGLVREAIAANEMDVEIDQGLKGLDTSTNDSDIDILKRLQNLKIDGNDDDSENVTASITTDNEVFNMDIPSSKIEKLMEIIREKVQDTDDKAIIVSQWVSYLNIVKGMLEVDGIGYCELNGKVPIKFRNDIVVNFNKPNSNERVMLLSITAGGVGLNLVGANLLFILDPHWNPQIEQQAQDRIYRFGQNKNVKIFKFICEDTIEEKILKIQNEKMNVAESALTGAKRSASKLTIEDLKDLFGMK